MCNILTKTPNLFIVGHPHTDFDPWVPRAGRGPFAQPAFDRQPPGGGPGAGLRGFLMDNTFQIIRHILLDQKPAAIEGPCGD